MFTPTAAQRTYRLKPSGQRRFQLLHLLHELLNTHTNKHIPHKHTHKHTSTIICNVHLLRHSAPASQSSNHTSFCACHRPLSHTHLFLLLQLLHGAVILELVNKSLLHFHQLGLVFLAGGREECSQEKQEPFSRTAPSFVKQKNGHHNYLLRASCVKLCYPILSAGREQLQVPYI